MALANDRAALLAELSEIKSRQPKIQRALTALEDRMILDRLRVEEIEQLLATLDEEPLALEAQATSEVPDAPSPRVPMRMPSQQIAPSKSKTPVTQRPVVRKPKAALTAPAPVQALPVASEGGAEKSSAKITKHPFRIRRVNAIDGLRGLAVLAVVIYHFFGDFMRGGYLGVDLFFVLSGFLITSLLVREKAVNGRIDLKDFWLRRARRIVPAAVVTLVVCTGLAGIVGGDPAVGLTTQFFSTLFFVNNWAQIAGSESYFADSGVQIFAHYWSLAVEEQFYLLWPLIFVAIAALGIRSRKMRWFALGGAIVSQLWMLVLHDPNVDPTRVYYGTDTHAFGLLIGAALALWLTSESTDPKADSWPAASSLEQGRSQLLSVVSIVSLAGLVALLFSVPDTATITYRGGLFAATGFATLVLYAVVRGIGPVSQIFDAPLLRWLGKVSFSLYLWHWPIVILLKEFFAQSGLANHTWALGLISLAISLPLAEASYRFVETPVRRHGYRAVFVSLVGNTAPIVRRVLAPATVGALVAAAVFAMATGPAQTQLEMDLAKAAAVKQQAEKAEKLRLEEISKREIPTGDKISAIGDSVMLASADALNSTFPDLYIDAAVSRHYQEAESIIAQMEAAETLDPFVVLGFGTNGASSGARDGLLSDILDQIGEERIVVLVLPYGDRDWMPEAEAEVLKEAEKRDNVYVADWCHAVRDNTSVLRGDLIHPTPEGAELYAQAIKDALNQWKTDKKKIPGTCGV